MRKLLVSFFALLVWSSLAVAQAPSHTYGPSAPAGVPAGGGPMSGPLSFTGSGISTGLPTNGIYLNSANQCGLTAGPTIALAAKDGAPVLRFMSSSETPTSNADSVALGYGALAAWQCAGVGPVTALGSNALLSLTTGDHDTAIGYAALSLIQTSEFNTAVGIDSGRYLADPSSSNTFFGQQTGTFGSSATVGLGTITQGTYIGYSAGEYAGGQLNTAVGAGALNGVNTSPLPATRTRRSAVLR